MAEDLVSAIEKNAAHQAAGAAPVVVESCDGCGPAVRAVQVWVREPTEADPRQRLLTFCAHCSRLQGPALQAKDFNPLSCDDTR